MLKKIKEYLSYRKNVRTTKRELARIAATVLPVAREISDRKALLLKFIINLVDGAKNMNGDKLVETVLNETSNALQTSNERLIEIFTYIASLTQNDVRKILTHAVVETNKNTKSNKNL